MKGGGQWPVVGVQKKREAMVSVQKNRPLTTDNSFMRDGGQWPVVGGQINRPPTTVL